MEAVIEEIEVDSDDLVGACNTRVRYANAETQMILPCTSSLYAKTGAGQVPHACSVDYSTQVWRGEGSRRT